MASDNQIKQFLDQVHRRQAQLKGLNGGLLILLLGLGALLSTSVFAYLVPGFRDYLIPYTILWVIPFVWVAYTYFIQGALAPCSQEDTALFVEKQVGDLNNSLINSVQLDRTLKTPASPYQFSSLFIKRLIQSTGQRVESLKAETLVPADELILPRNLVVGMAVLVLGLFLAWPDFFTQGWQNLTTSEAEASLMTDGVGASGSAATETSRKVDINIEQIDLTFNYPAYTRRKRQVLENTSGRIQVLPGTEVIVQATTNKPVTGGELALNGRDFFSMTLSGPQKLQGRFITKENGFYQFQVRPESGEKFLMPTEYPVEVSEDQPPRIVIFLANPKPMYHPSDKIQLFYEAQDDFGLSKIDLIVDANGEVTRHTLKTVKSLETELKDSYLWDLAATDFEPGARVQYYLEAFDNDNILGPNVGQSEIFSFEMFNEFQERQDLLALQEQLLEKMIGLLAQTLVTNPRELTGTPQGMSQLKRVLGSSTDQLIEIISLAQTILEQAKSIESFPKPYLTLLHNIIKGFNEIREEHLQAMNGLDTAIGLATPIGLDFPPVEPVHQKLVTHLERDILLLVKIINLERLDQAMEMQDDLQALAEKLRQQFEKAQKEKATPNRGQFKKEIQKIKETIQKIMNQLAKQIQGLSEQFLNPKAFENLNLENFDASLEKLMDLVNKGKLEEAMKQLESLTDDLQLLSQQLDQMLTDQGNLMDLETMRQLDEARAKIDHLEKEEKKILSETTEINKELRSKQSDRFEQQLTDFFTSLRKDVNQIQSILRENQHLLEQDAGMKTLEALLDEESTILETTRELNQKTLDAIQDDDLQERFQDLNKNRKQLSEVTEKIKGLRMKMFHGFKTYLPQLKDQYDRLEEFTELQDLNEFDALFKNTYPEVYRWENQIRSARELRTDLQETLTSDLHEVSRLNSEISKKLGTMQRDLRDDYRALISKNTLEKLQSMAENQADLEKQSGEVTESFKQLNRDNPMIPPVFGYKMSQATRNMKDSKRYLEQQNIPDGIQAENRALRDLAEIKDMLKQMSEGQENSGQQKQQKMVRLGTGRARDSSSGGGSVRMQKEKVNLPTEDQYKVPQKFREEILDAMKHQFPQQYERMVSEYYKELVK